MGKPPDYFVFFDGFPKREGEEEFGV